MVVTSPHVVDVGGAEFDADVLERSHQTPVLVDFWAPWCGPCRALGPILEQLAAEFGGKFVLAKVNTEAHPDLGSRFQVRSIPAVKLFHKGQAIAEFVGALPGSAVRRFIETHLPSEADQLMREAEHLLGQGDRPRAREVLREALETDPQHPGAHLLLARLAWLAGEAEIVRHHVQEIGAERNEYDAARHLLDALRFHDECAATGGEAACRAKLEQDQGDLDARYGLGCCLVVQERYEEALEAFLELVQRKRKYRDEAGRKAMLTIFGLIGRRSKLADRFVRQLQIYT